MVKMWTNKKNPEAVSTASDFFTKEPSVTVVFLKNLRYTISLYWVYRPSNDRAGERALKSRTNGGQTHGIL